MEKQRIKWIEEQQDQLDEVREYASLRDREATEAVKNCGWGTWLWVFEHGAKPPQVCLEVWAIADAFRLATAQEHGGDPRKIVALRPRFQRHIEHWAANGHDRIWSMSEMTKIYTETAQRENGQQHNEEGAS